MNQKMIIPDCKLTFVQIHKQVIQENQLSSMISASINSQQDLIEDTMHKILNKLRSFSLLDTQYGHLTLMNSVDFFFSAIFQRIKNPVIVESPSNLPFVSDVTIAMTNFLKYIFTPTPQQRAALMPIPRPDKTMKQSHHTSKTPLHWLTNYSPFMPIFLHCISHYFQNKQNLNEQLIYNPCYQQESFFSCSTFPAIFGYGYCVELGVAYANAILELMKIEIVRIKYPENLLPKIFSNNDYRSEFDYLSDDVIQGRIESFEFRNSFVWTIIRQFLHIAGIQEYLHVSLSTFYWAFINDETILKDLIPPSSPKVVNQENPPKLMRSKTFKKIKPAEKLIPLDERTPSSTTQLIQNEYQKREMLIRVLQYADLFINSLLKNISRIPPLIRYFFYKIGKISNSNFLIEIVFFDYLLQPALFNPKLFALIPETSSLTETAPISLLARIFKYSLHPEKLKVGEYVDLLTEVTDDVNSPSKLFQKINLTQIISLLKEKPSLDWTDYRIKALKIPENAGSRTNAILLSANDVAFIIRIITTEIDNIDIFEDCPNNQRPKYIDHVNIREKSVILRKMSFSSQFNFMNDDLIEFWYKLYNLPVIKISKTKEERSLKRRVSSVTVFDGKSLLQNLNANIAESSEHDDTQTSRLRSASFRFPHSDSLYDPEASHLYLPLFEVPEVEPFDKKDPYIKSINHLYQYLLETKPLQPRNMQSIKTMSMSPDIDKVTLMSFLEARLRHAIRVKSYEWITRTQSIYNKIKSMNKSEEQILSSLLNLVNDGLKKSSSNLALLFTHQEFSDQLNTILTKTSNMILDILPIAYQFLLKRFSVKYRALFSNIDEIQLMKNKSDLVRFFTDDVLTSIEQFIRVEIEKPTKNSKKAFSKKKKKYDEQRITDPVELENIQHHLNRQFHSDICMKYFTFSKYLKANGPINDDQKLLDNYDLLLSNFLIDDSASFSPIIKKLQNSNLLDSPIDTLRKGIRCGAPLERLQQIYFCSKEIQDIYLYETGENASADDFLPLFICVLLKAKIPNLISLYKYLDHFLFSLENMKILSPSEQYTTTTFASSVNWISKELKKL